jgi:peptidoglycan/LPS O-acetylase OafA/YrhL
MRVPGWNSSQRAGGYSGGGASTITVPSGKDAAVPGYERLGRRPALDGIRGVAVLLVIARHLHVPVIQSGGTVGVGLFFGLSGFLITSLLVEERHLTARVRLGQFYLRRFFRLIPALLLMLACIVVLGEALGSPGIGRDSLYALFYAGNWAQIAGGYFPALAQTWSLAVEEHFYLVWPMAFLVAWRYGGRRAALAVAACGAVAALILRLSMFEAGAAAVRLQYGSDDRADAILVGAAVALITAGQIRQPPRWLTYGSWAVLAALLVAAPVGHLMLTAGFSLVAIASAVIAADAAAGRSFAARALRIKPLITVGAVSYGLYLWHFPIIKLLEPPLSEHLPHALAVVVVVVLFTAAALLSYFLVERPALELRRSRFERRRTRATAAPRIA